LRRRPAHTWRNMTVTCRTVGDTVTVPVAWSTVPAEVDAMLRTKLGSWKRTGPVGRAPLSRSVTALPEVAMTRSARRPFVVGKWVTASGE
jgi:hypothetical protein